MVRLNKRRHPAGTSSIASCPSDGKKKDKVVCISDSSSEDAFWIDKKRDVPMRQKRKKVRRSQRRHNKKFKVVDEQKYDESGESDISDKEESVEEKESVNKKTTNDKVEDVSNKGRTAKVKAKEAIRANTDQEEDKNAERKTKKYPVIAECLKKRTEIDEWEGETESDTVDYLSSEEEEEKDERKGLIKKGQKQKIQKPSKKVNRERMKRRVSASEFETDDKDSDDSGEDDDDGKYSLLRIERAEKETLLYKIKHEDMNLPMTDFCIACEKVGDITIQHPTFEGGQCNRCANHWRDAAFALDPNGDSVYCMLCTNGGILVQCSDPSCSKGYCTGCIRDFLSSEQLETIKEQHEWYCFLCSPYTKETHGLLRPKPDWKTAIKTLFQPDGLINPSPKEGSKKTPIRVLSLFDGISTGRVILKELGIKVDKYYASEVDPDALAVSKQHHEDIVHLGDVRSIDHHKLKQIGPIDLLIGGSPCADFTLVNPSRRGLGGPNGILFFEFYRIWTELPMLFKDTHLFWLFENTTSMERYMRDNLSRYFRCEPAKWNSLSFTAMKRDRLFWGNLPSIYCPVSYSEQDFTKIKLGDVLMGKNRTAKEEFVYTITTTTAKTRVAPPVLYEGEPDYLWTPEIERLFGFPAHYTDLNNMTPTRRQKLLGKSWSVPVVKHLLQPLKTFFSCSPMEASSSQ